MNEHMVRSAFRAWMDGFNSITDGPAAARRA